MRSATLPATGVRLTVRVDPVACDAYGYCAELLPERVTLDEWGYPVVDGTPLEPGLVALASRAAAECPRRAFHLDRGQALAERAAQAQRDPGAGSTPVSR